jgi:hypothetical protein
MPLRLGWLQEWGPVGDSEVTLAAVERPSIEIGVVGSDDALTKFGAVTPDLVLFERGGGLGLLFRRHNPFSWHGLHLW